MNKDIKEYIELEEKLQKQYDKIVDKTKIYIINSLKSGNYEKHKVKDTIYFIEKNKNSDLFEFVDFLVKDLPYGGTIPLYFENNLLLLRDLSDDEIMISAYSNEVFDFIFENLDNL